MPRPNQPTGPSEIQKLRIIMEEVRSQQKLLLQGLKGVTERLDGIEFRLGRVEQEFSEFRLSIIAHSTEIRRLQHDVQKLQHEVAKLAERFEEHLKSHVT